MLTIPVLLLWLAFALSLLLRRAPSPVGDRIPALVAAVAWGLWTAALARRGTEAGHWPMSTRYEFGLAFVWMTLTLHLLLEAEGLPRAGRPWTLLVTAGLATLVAARPGGERAIAPLPPVLRSVWFPLHTFATAVAYGAAGIAAGLAAAGLLEPDEEVRERLERERERATGWAFLWLTAGILLGALWARDAWGRFWGWDPKETWSLILWLWYLLPFHLRPLPRWRGRRTAAIVIAAFGGVLFLLWGVPWLIRAARLESLHGF